MGSPSQNLSDLWERAQSSFESTEGYGPYKNWIAPLKPGNKLGGVLFLEAPTRFILDWVANHYQEKLLAIFQGLDPKIEAIKLVVTGDAPSQTSPTPAPTEANTDATEDALTLHLDPRFTFENFVVGKSNELAFAAAQKVSEAKEVAFNPLFLHGGVGLGKTHLMHAIAWNIKKVHPDRVVIYLSAEKFMYQFISAIRQKDTFSFKDRFRSVDVLMIDDVQFIAGKESTQEEFFHTFNALIDQKKQIILSADKSPSDLSGFEERIRSRLGWGLVADIHPTTFELRLGILQAKAEKLPPETFVPKDVIEFLAGHINTNVRELEGALNRVVAHASLVGRNITVSMAQEVLRDLLRVYDKQITIEDIQKKAAHHFNVKLSDLLSSKRSSEIALARQVAMYLSKTMTSNSLPEIGRRFNGKNHTTVLHAVKKIESRAKESSSLQEDIAVLKRNIQG